MLKLAGAEGGFLAVSEAVAEETETVEGKGKEPGEVASVAAMTGEREGVVVGHVAGHVLLGGKDGAEKEPQFANQCGAGNSVGHGTDAGEIVFGFGGGWLRSNEQNAFSGEGKILVIEVGGAEGVEEAGREWRGEEISA